MLPSPTGISSTNAIASYVMRRRARSDRVRLRSCRPPKDRDIPWLRLNRYSLVQFGHGRYQQRIQATTTGRTSNIAVDLAGDKEETNGILRDLGLPVPEQRIVRHA